MCSEHQEILLELTYNQLLAQTKSGAVIRDSPRQQNSSRIQVQQVTLIPSIQDKTLTAKASMQGTTDKYEALVLFTGVQFFNDGGHGRQEIIAADNTKYFIDPIRPYKANVKIRCTCLDFYFRFATWDHRDDALHGDAPEPYQRRTKTYPPVNPQQVSGLCKHVIKLVTHLKSQRIIR